MYDLLRCKLDVISSGIDNLEILQNDIKTRLNELEVLNKDLKNETIELYKTLGIELPKDFN